MQVAKEIIPLSLAILLVCLTAMPANATPQAAEKTARFCSRPFCANSSSSIQPVN